MKAKISKQVVDAALPGQSIWDTKTRGFGVRVTKAGVATFVMKYCTGGQQRWVKIGRCDDLTADEARKEAERLRGVIALGGDPAAEKAQRVKEPTLANFAALYVLRYSRHHKKPSTVREEIGALRNHIVPKLGKMKVRAINREHVADLHRWIKSKDKGGPYAANRAAAQLRHMLNYAEDEGLREANSNPVRRLKMFKETPRERFLSPAELARLGAALEAFENETALPRSGAASAEKSNVYPAAAIRLLILTGARRNEILTLRWSEVDLDARLLRLEDSKTGRKSIALPAPAVEILAGLPKQAGNPFVICGAREGQHFVGLQKKWRRVCAAAGLDDLRLHDLRHCFASVGAAGGMSLPLIGSLLGHSQAATTHRYAHLANDPRLAAADSIAASITASMSGGSAEIIPLRSKNG